MKTVPMLMAALGLGSMLFLFAGTTYFLWFERPWLSYQNLPFPVVDSIVEAGQVAKLRVLRCNDSRVLKTYVVTRTLVNVETQTREILPSTAVVILPGCSAEISAINIIPEGTAPGRYFIDGTAEIKGLIRPMRVSWMSREFTVVKP